MWRIIQRLDTCSNWKTLAESEDLDSLNFKKEKKLFILWSSDLHETIEQQNTIIRKTIELNDGEVLRASIGVDVTINRTGRVMTCSGDCYCVVTETSRECETKFCAGDYCWWIRCGEAC